MKRWLKTFVFAIATAVALGYGLMRAHFGLLPIVSRAIIGAALAAGICALAWKLYYKPATVPFEQTRRFARMMYHNGTISMEELQEFYDTHPEADDDGSNSTSN